MDIRVARRYARALFETARKLDVIQSVEDDLAAFASLVKNDEQFRDFLLSPKVGREEKVQIAYRLFSDRVTAVSMQAFRLILHKRREAELEGIYDEFVKLRREEGNTIFAQVTSAEPLSDDVRERLRTKLETETGKRVEAEYRVDPALIGGIRVAYSNYVLDGSLRGALTRLKENLKYNLLKQV